MREALFLVFRLTAQLIGQVDALDHLPHPPATMPVLVAWVEVSAPASTIYSPGAGRPIRPSRPRQLASGAIG